MTPTETATSPPNFKWEIGEYVSDETALEARDASEAMRAYLARFGLPDIDGDIVFYIYSDTASLSEAYARETGWSLENSVDFWESAVGVSGKGWIFLNVSNEWFASAPRARRMQVTASELYAAYQHGLSGLSGASQIHQVPESGPRWLSEGGAGFSAYRAISEIGELSYDEERDSTWGFAERAKSVDKPLSEMETWDGFASAGFGYDYSLMAAELLASVAGEGALMRYYALAQPGATWRDAFETAFGMMVEEFYDLFEDYRAAGFSMTPTETAISPPSVKWEIGDGVLDEVALETRESVEAMRAYLAMLGFPDIGCGVVFYIYNDTASLAEAYARETGWSLENSVDFWKSAAGVSGKGWVFLRALDEWLWSDPRARESHMKVTAHELYHVYQHCLSGLRGDAQNHQVPESGPRWLSEGSAEFSAYRAMSEIGELSYDEERRGFVERARRVDKPLSEMETWNGLASEAFGYTYSLMASELLASVAGEAALMRHYALAQPGATWRDAFETAFGMTDDEFYDLFEDHRAAGFPNP